MLSFDFRVRPRDRVVRDDVARQINSARPVVRPVVSRSSASVTDPGNDLSMSNAIRPKFRLFLLLCGVPCPALGP